MEWPCNCKKPQTLKYFQKYFLQNCPAFTKQACSKKAKHSWFYFFLPQTALLSLNHWTHLQLPANPAPVAAEAAGEGCKAPRNHFIGRGDEMYCKQPIKLNMTSSAQTTFHTQVPPPFKLLRSTLTHGVKQTNTGEATPVCWLATMWGVIQIGCCLYWAIPQHSLLYVCSTCVLFFLTFQMNILERVHYAVCYIHITVSTEPPESIQISEMPQGYVHMQICMWKKSKQT